MWVFPVLIAAMSCVFPLAQPVTSAVSRETWYVQNNTTTPPLQDRRRHRLSCLLDFGLNYHFAEVEMNTPPQTAKQTSGGYFPEVSSQKLNASPCQQ